MDLSRLLPKFFSGRHRPIRRKYSSFSLHVEILEQRSVLTEFVGTSVAMFLNPGSNTPIASSPVTTGIGTRQITWGDTSFGTPPSGLTFVAASNFDIEAGALFSLGSLTFFNGISSCGTMIDAIDFSLSADFSLPSEVGRQTFTLPFDILNTPNLGDPVADADSVFLTPNFFVNSFTAPDGSQFALVLDGFGTGDGTRTTNQLSAQENASTSTELMGRFIQIANVLGKNYQGFIVDGIEPAVVSSSDGTPDFNENLPLNTNDDELSLAPSDESSETEDTLSAIEDEVENPIGDLLGNNLDNLPHNDFVDLFGDAVE